MVGLDSERLNLIFANRQDLIDGIDKAAGMSITGLHN